MTHFEKIAAKLKEKDLDAMLITSEPGEFYAMGFHGEGVAFITPNKTWYYTDSRYIESAQQLISGAEVALPPKDSNYFKLAAELVKENKVSKLGFEEKYMSVAAHTGGQKRWRPSSFPPPSCSPPCGRSRTQASWPPCGRHRGSPMRHCWKF